MQGKDGPHEGIAIFGALFTTWPPMWGHSSRCFAFGGVSPCIICGRRGSDGIHSSRDRFSKVGKTILDPFTRTVHSPPGLAADRPGNCRGLSAPSTGHSPASLPLKPRFARGAALSLLADRTGDENAASQIRTEAMYDGLSTGLSNHPKPYAL
jgi:hypothetical protein